MSLRAREAKIETSIDHRSRRRHRLLLEVEAKASKSLSSFVTVYDISDTGMLVETDASFIVGEMIEVNLPHAGHQTAEIVWVSGQLIGCKFADRCPFVIAKCRAEDPPLMAVGEHHLSACWRAPLDPSVLVPAGQEFMT